MYMLVSSLRSAWQRHSRLQQQAQGLHRRSFSSQNAVKTVKLSYSSVIPENGNAHENPLVILHGLFGSKRNWGSFSKAFHRDLPNRPIYALDLRNHGTSPHARPMTYEAMVQDVHEFVLENRLTNATLLGHSMGGKVAMAYALAAPERLSSLIVADIAPSIGNLSSDFVQYISLMQRIEALPSGRIVTRSDADKILALHEPDMSIRQFLLTNLQVPITKAEHHQCSHSAHHKHKFVVPLDILSESMLSLGSFPHQYNVDDGTVPISWDGPTLAIKGRKSPYINHKNIPIFRAFFPKMRLEELDAGHWVHAEKPTEFRKLVVDFLGY